jgi:hypothetical protein
MFSMPFLVTSRAQAVITHALPRQGRQRGLVTLQSAEAWPEFTGRVAAEHVQDASPKSAARLGSAADVTKARLQLWTGRSMDRHLHFISAFRAAVGIVFLACVAAPATAEELSSDEKQLIAALDRAFRPGILDTRNVRKAADGTYVRSVSTGDAIMKPSVGKPLATLRSVCSETGGALDLKISAGREAGETSTALEIGTSRLSLGRSEMWEFFSPGAASNLKNATAKHGFAPLFAASPFADRATRDAEADPPFGLFACTKSKDHTVWAAAIMPLSGVQNYGAQYAYDLPVMVTPITVAWVRRREESFAAAMAIAERAKRDREAGWAREAARMQAEEERLRPFRAALKVGSRTNCGLVIAVRNPLVQVQLPPHISRQDGTREFWVERNQLTDATPPDGCRFGG